MATLSAQGPRFIVQWVPADAGSRRTLSLGRIRRRDAEAICNHITTIVASQIRRTALPDATSRWVNEVGPKLHKRLVAKGLALPRDASEAPTVALDAMCDSYIKRRTDLKPGTRTILQRTRANLTAFFTAGRNIDGISKAEAVDWHRWVREKLSGATAYLYAKKARQMFADAVDRRLIAENPFKRLKLGSGTNPARLVYIPAAAVNAVIDATPDREWKLLFALARFGGLRVPSEIRELKWADVNLGEGRMLVRSPKTEHHEGKAQRQVPIGASLAPLLTEAFTAAPAVAMYVLPRLRAVTNLGTTGDKLIGRAGQNLWPKTFQNLRASCETDWAVLFPIHVACAWTGNTTAIAAKHYLQVTDDHWRAACSAAEAPGTDRKTTEHAVSKTPVNAGEISISNGPRGARTPAGYPLNPQVLLEAMQGALRRQARRRAAALPCPAAPHPASHAAEGRRHGEGRGEGRAAR